MTIPPFHTVSLRRRLMFVFLVALPALAHLGLKSEFVSPTTRMQYYNFRLREMCVGGNYTSSEPVGCMNGRVLYERTEVGLLVWKTRWPCPALVEEGKKLWPKSCHAAPWNSYFVDVVCGIKDKDFVSDVLGRPVSPSPLLLIE